MKIEVINPADGRIVKSYEEMKPDEVTTVIKSAHEAFRSWKKRPFSERAVLMKKSAGVLRDNADEYARLMAVEMGKPVKEGRAEAEKCAWVCEYYADNAETFLKDQAIKTEAAKSYVAFNPLGVVLAVMPWNYPFWQVFRFAAPSLMAGNAGILKHASNVPGCALAIEDVFKKAGFPTDIFRSLIIGSRQVEKVIENKHVAAVTLTGSTDAGKAVAGKAGEMLKKTVLELGGSDPYLVLEDADLTQAVNACVKSRLINAGQSCISAKRFIVVDSIRKKFEEMFVEQLEKKIMGDPMSEDTDIGPQARHDLRDELHDQVVSSIESGAKLLSGGTIPSGEGAFYPPTVLTDVKKGMPAFDEELFGPVAAVIPAASDEEAVKMANDSVFGLGAAVFTADIEKGERIASRELEAGCCFVNTFVKSDPRLPFGGIKESGFGRELSHYGIREFVNIKTVLVK